MAIDRRPNIVTRRVRILFLVLGAAFIGLNSAAIIITRKYNEIKKIDEFVPSTHYVTSLNDLVKTSYKNINGNYILMSDIVIKDDSPLKNATLKGSIDGNGFNIYVSGNIKNSIIHSIAKGAVVKNLGVYYSDCSFEDLEADFGGLATYNEGKIENCFSYINASLEKASLFGGLVAYNKGTIKHTLSDITIVENTNYIDNYAIGGIAAADMNGEIEKCYSALTSDYITKNRDAILSHEAFASLEGNFIATKTKNTKLKSLYSVQTMLPHIDRYYDGIKYVDSDEVKPELFLSDDYDLQFSSEIWDMSQTQFDKKLVDYCSVKKEEH